MTGASCRLLLLFALFSCVCEPAGACSLVYGSNWAFVSESPAGWNAACGNDALDGTALTLWPASQETSSASALIYVTVSKKEQPLSAFAQDELASFKQESTRLQVLSLPITPRKDERPYLLFQLNNASDGREEIVSYLEGPESYYILVLTADSIAALDQYRDVFLAYLADFNPMVRK